MTFYAGLCFVGVAALSAIRAELVVESCAAADLRQPLTLKYWNGRGLMEIARMILAVGGKFPVLIFRQLV